MRPFLIHRLPASALVVVVAVLAPFVVAGCSNGDGGVVAGAASPTTAVTVAPTSTSVAVAETTLPVSPLASLVKPLDTARYDPAEHATSVAPVRVSVEGVGADDVVVRTVGLEPNGEMEVPPEDEVGWYRYSVPPGGAGSSVLAGHVAFNGRDGAFRSLARVDIGAEVTVAFADGTERSFTVTTVNRYLKDQLPRELFRTGGDPVLTLITCGGTFQPSLRSYDSNIVVTAVPVRSR